ncbi:hypothetical protein [Bacillus thuringiensis]|uniref:hypothetical protein n=1 Tax=Bacillus cereus group TaxID=86661 RepID=UPI0018CE7234|nr:hypothetical protein [Bacillus thuringiensis]MEB9340128.1 hypothetical protein [Bacillus cereus]HEF1879950.1 hypothetical protein [Bacillus cereus]
MELPVQCECENCKKNRLNLQPKNKCFHGIYEGDYIKVFSSGNFMGMGTFLRVEGHIIIWIDKRGNINLTDISGVSVRKISTTSTSKETDSFDIKIEKSI